jgi:hypothetical protein
MLAMQKAREFLEEQGTHPSKSACNSLQSKLIHCISHLKSLDLIFENFCAESLLLSLLSKSSPTMPFPTPSGSQNRSHTEWQILHTPGSLFLKDSPVDRFLGNASALQKQAEDLRSIKAKVAALQQEMSIATQRAQLAEAEVPCGVL